MSTIVKFDHRAFKKGVNDALTLAPLRDAIRSVTAGSEKTGNWVAKKSDTGKSSTIHGNPPTRGPKR